MTDQELLCFKCPNVGTALAVIAQAKLRHLNASYLPNGGDTALRNVEVTHRIYILGELGDLYAMRTWIKENYDNIQEI